MPRDLFLELAARGHRVPLATDLVLHEHDDAERIGNDGARLGAVIAETAAAFHTPLAFPLMDLRLEKAELLRHFDVPAAEIDTFHFEAAPAPERLREVAHLIRSAPPGARATAALDALHHVAAHTDLVPVGMCIGPFSLTSKLIADPITPVYLAGTGATAEEEAEVALLDACLEISLACVLRQVQRAITAGARVVFIAEPAANEVYFSPLQLEAGSDVFERCVLRPNARIADLLADRGVDFVFHCCGEITGAMLAGFCTLRPAMLSLGSSRRLWEDAARVPDDIVLYGNLPSKLFYSDALMPLARVGEMADELVARMAASGHPFVAGTECDTLHVPGHADTIRAKVDRLLGREPVKADLRR